MDSLFLDRVDSLAQISQKKLVLILNKIPGRKNLVIDPTLMKPLDRFIGASVFRNHGVDKMYNLYKISQQNYTYPVIYIIRADIITAKTVCNQINSYLNTNAEFNFHIILVPKLLSAIELLFEEEGLFGRVTFHTFSWELIQLDSKILSFETPKIFRQLFIEYDQSFLTSIAKSLWSMVHIFGKPSLSIFHGKYSNLISNMIECFLEEEGEPDHSDSDIGCMLVLDRDVDYVPALLMPGTYTSLMSEVMNVTTGSVELKQQNKEKKEITLTLYLSSENEIYNQIKNKHFSQVNIYLKQKANELISEKNKGNTMNIQEMKTFVENKLEKLRNDSVSLSNHFKICEKICSEMGQKFEMIHTCQTNILYGEARREVLTDIEDMISVSEDISLPLRLLCLLSLAQNGFTEEESKHIKKQFVHSYGHEHLTTFYNLEKSGLFSVPQNSGEISLKIANKVVQAVPFPKKNSIQLATQKLKLFPDITKDCCLKNPQNPAYVFGGVYIPLVAQIVSYLLKKEMSLNELIKSLPGNVNGKFETRFFGNQLDGALNINPRTVIVYLVGGITYAEIAALQFVEAQTGSRILCCGSSVVNAKNIFQSAF